MSGVIIAGDVSGTVTLQAPSAAGSTVINLPANSMNIGNGGGNVATNTAVGASALAANTSGSNNTAVGYQAAYSNQTDPYVTAFGAQAAYSHTAGSILAVGYQAAYSNTTGGNNTAVGRYRTLYSNTTGGNNSAFGNSALTANTTGSSNTALGADALAQNTTASNNTAVGYQAGYSGTTAAGNALFGYQAGYSASTGNTYLTAIGNQAGYSSATAQYNTFVGLQAGYSTTGGSNTFVGVSSSGYGAGYYVSTGTKNTILGGYNGNQGGLDIRTASNYIVLSDGDGNPRQVIDGVGQPIWGPGVGNGVSGINTASFAYDGSLSPILTFNNNYGGGTKSAVQFKRNSTVVGSITENGSTTAYNTSSDYRLKENIAPLVDALGLVSQLKPVTYTWKNTGISDSGFIAHELAEVCPNAVVGEKDAVDENGEPVYQGIDVSFLVGTLTAAIQELNTKIDAQAAEIAALKGNA